MNAILLLPLLLYAFLLAINVDLLSKVEKVNLFWAATVEVQIFLFSTIFIIVYLILAFFIYDWVNVLLKHKIKNLEEEVVQLKAKLYDWQKVLIDKIDKSNHETLEKIQKENLETLEKHQKDTDKILEKLNLVDKKVLDKIRAWKK